MSEKTATTLNINTKIKQDFKIQCIKNGVDMSETVEQMMSDYTAASVELHELRTTQIKENG